MRTAIVILNWNTKDYLEKFLPGVIASAADAEVIVADSASTDGSMEMMAEKFPGIRTIALDGNYGFTGGYNRALESLKNDGFEYYILLNSDIEVPHGWLEPLTGFMDGNPDCGACAPKLHSWYERDMFEYAGAAGGLLDVYGYPFCRGRVMKKVERDHGQYDSGPADVFWATGACIMVRSGLWHQFNGLDDRFFAHMEEIDLCWRMQLAGWRICVVPTSVVYHLGGGTLPQTSPWKLKLNFRNNLLLLENNLAKTYALRLWSGDAERDARKAYRFARKTIWERMMLDRMSAVVYLLTGKFGYATAVHEAHKEYRRMRTTASRTDIEQYIRTHGGKGITVKGSYPRWIILHKPKMQ